MDLSSANGGISVVADTTAGNRAGLSLATNAACALWKWNGGTRSRSSRGRTYFGPIAESDINSDGRTLVGQTITDMNQAQTNFRNTLQSNNFTLCVVSRTLQQGFDVTQSTTESVIATQRRRIRA
jgi:hypothetical protein